MALPFLALVRSLNKGELPSFEFRLLLIFISLLFALFSYFYIEFPIRKKKLNFVLITSLCVLMGITGMLGSLAPRTSFIFPESYQKFVNFEKNKKNLSVTTPVMRSLYRTSGIVGNLVIHLPNGRLSEILMQNN